MSSTRVETGGQPAARVRYRTVMARHRVVSIRKTVVRGGSHAVTVRKLAEVGDRHAVTGRAPSVRSRPVLIAARATELDRQGRWPADALPTRMPSVPVAAGPIVPLFRAWSFRSFPPA
jgi:hypothetical protein